MTDSESEESERFHFLPTPLTTPSLPGHRFPNLLDPHLGDNSSVTTMLTCLA